MTRQKIKMLMFVIPGIILPFLLVGISYLLIPIPAQKTPVLTPPTPMPFPKPEPLIEQFFLVIQWLGLAFLVALSIMGIILLIYRRANKK